MKVRFAEIADTDRIVEMARTNAATVPHLTFNETRTRATIVEYLMDGRPVIWVAEADDGLAGFLMASFYAHRAFDGLFTVQEVLFVEPDRRGGRAAVLLMRAFLEWSEQMGANEVVGGVDNATDVERTARFLEKLGFARCGHAMKRVLRHGVE